MSPKENNDPISPNISCINSEDPMSEPRNESFEAVLAHFPPEQQETASPQETSNQDKNTNQQEIAMNTSSTAVTSNTNTLFGLEMPFDVLSAGYAAIVAAGGLIGYLKAGSIPSLVAGLSFGSVLGVGAYMTSVNPENYYLSLGTSAVLGSFMGYRFINSGKFMPPGLIALLSIGMVARFSVRAFTQIKSHNK